MTMRLDIVSNDAGELVRREHARELGANVVIAVYRLAKLAQVHDLQNQAFTRQLEQTHQVIGDYCLRSGMNVQVLFAHKAIFVAGQLLKGSRGAYEAASELGEIFDRLGGSDLFIERSVSREELMAFAEQISLGFRAAPGSFRSPTTKIRLRQVTDAARLRGLELEDLQPDQKIVRAYASAVVIMRRFFEDLMASRYILPRRIKRIAQSLVDLSEGSTVSFLGVTEVRNANFDEAGRAVNSAILAVAVAREVTPDRAVLSQIAMAAMMHDVARPRAMALAGSNGDPSMPGMAGPTVLSEDQEDRLAAGSAAVLTALGRVNEPTITRTVLAFEALWIRRQTWLGPVYWGARPPTLHAKIIAVARRYNDLLTPEPGVMPPTTDYAVAKLSEELTDPQDRIVLRMLVAALGLLPMGTVVQLNTGEVAEVVRGPKGPLEKPRIRVVMDANGQQIQPVELELADDPHRSVTRVIAIDGWKKGLGDAPTTDFDQPYDPDAADDEQAVPQNALPPPAASSPPLQNNRSIADQYADQYATWGESEQAAPRRDSSSIQSGEHNSLPSMGSSPSAVAEAMGRMINDSLKPPAMTPGGPERTLYQPGGPDESADRATKRPPREPTARGNLSATPLPHVLVYMLDHALTGSVVFDGLEGADTIHFVNGVPTKIKLVSPVGMLGELLLSAGAIDQRALDQAVESARRLGIKLGEYLVGHDLASREIIAWGLEAQLLHKIAHLANLAPEIEYAFYREQDLLEGWGGSDVPMGAPLNPILASVRNWTDRARVRATLNRIGKHALVLHEDSDVSKLALLPEEQQVLDLIKSEDLSVTQLFKRAIADEEVVSSLVYALAVTRQFAFKGQKKGPMAPGGVARAAAAISSSRPAAPSGSRPNQAAASAQPAAQIEPQVQVQPQAMAATGSAPPRNRLGDTAPDPRPSVAPDSTRAPVPRAIAPAARPGAASAPQVRVQKKATMVGMQPAVPSGTRGLDAPPPSNRKIEIPAPVVTPRATPPDVSDEAKTIALTAPKFPKPAPRAARGALGLPSQSRPVPAAGTPARVPAPPASPRAHGNGTSGNPDSTDKIRLDRDAAAADAVADAMTNFRMAEASLQRSDTAGALRLAEKAAAADPTQPDYLALAAWIRAMGGNPQSMEDAIRTLSRVLIEDPANERALLYRGKLLVRTNRLQEAMTDFTELLSSNPMHREAATEVRMLKQKMPL